MRSIQWKVPAKGAVMGLAWLAMAASGQAAQASGGAAALQVPQASQAPLAAVARAGQALVAVGDHGVVLSSRDGLTWRQARQVPVDTLLTAACFSDADHGWAVGHGGTILSTQDGGASWQWRHRVDKAPVLLSVACQGPSQVWVVGAYGTALHTRDGGQSWQPMAIGEGRDADLHLNAVVVGRRGTLVVAAEGGAAFRLAEDALSWSRVDTQATGSLWGALKLRDGTLMLYGMGGRIVVSHDDGQHWQSVASGTHEALTGAAQLDDGRVVLVGNGGVVVVSSHTPDAQMTFTAQVRPDRQNLAAVAPDGHGGVVVFGAAGVGEQRLADLVKTPAGQP